MKMNELFVEQWHKDHPNNKEEKRSMKVMFEIELDNLSKEKQKLLLELVDEAMEDSE